MMAERPADVPDFETAPTVRIDQAMPEKDSVIALSDSAFRLMVECICYCGRNETDGATPTAWLKKNGKPAAIKQLLEHGHLVVTSTTQHDLVDYLRWNRASAEIDAFRASKGEAGAKGAHMRWHVAARKKVRDCAFCYPNSGGKTNG